MFSMLIRNDPADFFLLEDLFEVVSSVSLIILYIKESSSISFRSDSYKIRSFGKSPTASKVASDSITPFTLIAASEIES